VPSLAKLHEQFYCAKLKKKTDLDVFIMYLEDLRVQMEEMGSTMMDNQFMLHIMNNLTKEYENQVSKVEDYIGHDDDPLDIKELHDELCLWFEMNTKYDSNKSNNGKKALFGATQFKGRCHLCSKWGHKGTGGCSKGQCGKEKDNKSAGTSGKKNFTGMCHYCNKVGHMKKEEGRRKKEEGRRKKEEGRRKKEEGRRKKEEGRKKKEEGRR
jgi:hypothetical protein